LFPPKTLDVWVIFAGSALAVFNKPWSVQVFFLRTPPDISGSIICGVFIDVHHNRALEWRRAVKSFRHQTMDPVSGAPLVDEVEATIFLAPPAQSWLPSV
jgi:hypothetical protein